MDFAENYSFDIQNEVQGFHWTNKQATVHPVVCYFRGLTGTIEHQSLCFLSEVLDHDVPMVYHIQKQTILYLETKIHSLSNIEYFTDGCTAQYKKFKSLLNLLFHEYDLGVSACWSFHATGHRKMLVMASVAL